MANWLDVFRAQLYSTVYWYKNNRLYFISMFIWPYIMVGMIFALGTMYGSIEEYKYKLKVADPALYLLSSSVVAMSSIVIVESVAGFALFNRWLGTLPYILLSPVKTPIILLVAGLPDSLLSPLLTVASVIPAAVYFEGWLGAGKALIVLLFIYLGMLPMLGFATLVGSVVLIVKEESNILNSLTPFILLVAGVFYPVEVLPVILQYISKIIPVTYVIEATKIVATYALPEGMMIFTLMYLIACMTLAYNLLALTAIRKSEVSVKKSGAI